MSNKLIDILIFTVGVLVGSAVTWKVMKDKYENKENELHEDKEEKEEKEEGLDEHEESVDEPEEEKEKELSIYDYKKMLDQLKREDAELDLKKKLEHKDKFEESNYISEPEKPVGYRYMSGEDTIIEKVFTDANGDCYLIEPDEFGCKEGYEAGYLVYYTDGVLTDEWDNIIEDVDGLVGLDAVEHFGIYEDDPDVVYIRNDVFKEDYEIERDLRKSTEVPRVVERMEKKNDEERQDN